ncbi:ATP-binding cassette sub-family B protein [Babesia gibsoni]|uniref:ATP-binding cassette sub-family B protein n=1 Tax=Babesia gibsoni TaxID=33632 RepID=A0AAD8US37_BABGI|nr:ATP-binding cassette sub-family B protein [Babesia gibsoni]
MGLHVNRLSQFLGNMASPHHVRRRWTSGLDMSRRTSMSRVERTPCSGRSDSIECSPKLLCRNRVPMSARHMEANDPGSTPLFCFGLINHHFNSSWCTVNSKRLIRRCLSTKKASSNKDDFELIKAGEGLTLSDLLWPKNSMLKKRIAISIAFLFISKIAVIAIPLCMSSMVNIMSGATAIENGLLSIPGIGTIGTTQLGASQACLVGYVGARLLSSLFTESRNAVFSTVMERTSMLNASKMFIKIHSLDMDLLIVSKSGEMSNIFARGVKAISQVLRILVFQVAPTILEFAMVTCLLCYKVGPIIASITTVTMAMYVAFTALVTQRRILLRKKMVDAEQNAAGVFTDCITNAEVVRYYNSESRELERYASQQKDYEVHAVNVQKSLSFLNFGQNFIFNSGLFLSMWLTLGDISKGTAQFGDLILVNTLLFQLAIPLNLIGTMYRETKTSMVDLNKFLELMQRQPKVREKPDAADLVVKAGKIEFKNVCHAYENTLSSMDTLKNFSLTVDKGKTVAIVGKSGSGKSTIAKLLFRLYEPYEGQILIDGQDIRDVTLRSLRNSIGIVPQDVVLFNESIEHNIRYGNPDASFEEVVKAAKLAGIHDAIAHMSDGYSTIVGERGMKLSGGEKQRIGIARCFLKNPKILIFDEATSSLDSLTEHKILSTFRKLSAERTTIVIAHRLSSMIEADEIAVFSDGRILEKGTPKELIYNTNGYLKEIVKSNQLAQKDERKEFT